jgi:cytochrome c
MIRLMIAFALLSLAASADTLPASPDDIAAGADTLPASPPASPDDIAAGAAIFERRCSQCHGLDRVNYRAPYLNGILGRPSASVPDWDYSPALKAWGGVWTEENLRAWLTKPQDLVPGTAMTFGGFRTRTEDRDRVIDFLLSAPTEPPASP